MPPASPQRSERAVAERGAPLRQLEAGRQIASRGWTPLRRVGLARARAGAGGCVATATTKASAAATSRRRRFRRRARGSRCGRDPRCRLRRAAPGAAGRRAATSRGRCRRADARARWRGPAPRPRGGSSRLTSTPSLTAARGSSPSAVAQSAMVPTLASDEHRGDGRRQPARHARCDGCRRRALATMPVAATREADEQRRAAAARAGRDVRDQHQHAPRRRPRAAAPGRVWLAISAAIQARRAFTPMPRPAWAAADEAAPHARARGVPRSRGRPG